MTRDGLFDLSGKVALVTGGGGVGLGAMMTRGLVESGVRVYICSNDPSTIEPYAEEMSEIGECVAITADLLDLANVQRLVDEISEREDQLDILVNNAGLSVEKPLASFDEKSWDLVMDLNAKAVFFMMQSCLPLLKAGASSEDPARIVNISSIAAVSPNSLTAYSYGASKAAVKQLTRTMAGELAPDQVLVNAIAPGWFPSKMTDSNEEADLIASNPIGRIGRPDDIVGLLVFLCSRAGSYMTGNYIPLDGGYLVNGTG